MALAAGLALTAACGSGDDGDEGEKSSESSAAQDKNGQEDAGKEGGGEDVPEEPIAEVKNQAGVVLGVMELQRDSGGFVTLNGELENTGDGDYIDTHLWAGSEQGVDKTSLMGATLVDPDGKKRYYALRDTDKRCLCTAGLTILEAGRTVPVYIQFPAPPDETTEVEFQLPTFPPVTVEITE
ncbi:hypothetical protein [Streptomyces sp. MAR4 CNX-425]|uniref:hypothetical protein n=1 Tax=Streptomyces sp. MAR4 CNX-425 TaxID=3406343 RepID=UPI003B4FFBB2